MRISKVLKNGAVGALACAAIAFVACTGDNAAVLPEPQSMQTSSSSDENVAGSPSSSSVENVAESSSSVIPDSLSPRTSSGAGSPSSSSTENATPLSSSETVADTVWHQANLTWYTSWPEPDSEECIEYNGCTWAGYFAGIEDQMTEEWVSQHNIIAVHEKDWNQYKLKTFRLRMNGSTIDAVVYDMCSDSDCDGCCTENAGDIGFLIDIEKYTRERFDGNGDGVVEWTCLDCE